VPVPRGPEEGIEMQAMEGVQTALDEASDVQDVSGVPGGRGEAQDEESDFEDVSMMPRVGGAQGGGGDGEQGPPQAGQQGAQGKAARRRGEVSEQRYKWEVSVQNNAHKTICGDCNGTIRVRGLRFRKANTRYTRVHHPHCIVGMHRGIQDMIGVDQLDEVHRARLAQELGEVGEMGEDTRVVKELAGNAAKRRRRATAEANGPVEELLYMGFWGQVKLRDIMTPIPTLGDPPRAVLSELARAKVTIMRTMNAANEEGRPGGGGEGLETPADHGCDAPAKDGGQERRPRQEGEGYSGRHRGKQAQAVLGK